VLRIFLMAVFLVVAWLVVDPSVRGGADRAPTAVTTGDQGPARTEASPAPAPTGVSPDPVTDPVSGLPWVEVGDLPRQARETLARIRAGGPYPYPRNDDQTFLNREGLLPGRPRGYYREFTVETPGSPDRGPRRIVTGAGGERYWTDDHYTSFARIREAT
jgi:ribonuclease T1